MYNIILLIQYFKKKVSEKVHLWCLKHSYFWFCFFSNFFEFLNHQTHIRRYLWFPTFSDDKYFIPCKILRFLLRSGLLRLRWTEPGVRSGPRPRRERPRTSVHWNGDVRRPKTTMVMKSPSYTGLFKNKSRRFMIIIA